MPQAMALAAWGEPVTRAPISSLSSRRFSYVSVFIIPAPATSASDLRVPSSTWVELPVADCPGAETAGRAITKIRATAQANANILRVISAEPLSDMGGPRTVRNFGRDFVGKNRLTLPKRSLGTFICAIDQEHLTQCFRVGIANSSRSPQV